MAVAMKLFYIIFRRNSGILIGFSYFTIIEYFFSKINTMFDAMSNNPNSFSSFFINYLYKPLRSRTTIQDKRFTKFF